MVSFGMLRRVALVRTTLPNIPEDTILHSHRREYLKSLSSEFVASGGLTLLCYYHVPDCS
jgi:hypothetical protein